MKTALLSEPTVVRCLRALGDEKRLAILMLLADGERCVCDIQEEVDAGQSLLSFHLRTLKQAGLVTDRRAGRWVHYSLSASGLRAVEDFLGGLRRAASRAGRCSSPRCCD